LTKDEEVVRLEIEGKGRLSPLQAWRNEIRSPNEYLFNIFVNYFDT
jgi:hypothetical protein